MDDHYSDGFPRTVTDGGVGDVEEMPQSAWVRVATWDEIAGSQLVAGVQAFDQGLVDEARQFPELAAIWKRGFSEMTEVARDLIITIGRSPQIRDDNWATGPSVSWEKDLFGEDFPKVRERFAMNCIAAHITSEDFIGFRDRWERAEFDSVMNGCVVIANVFVELGKEFPKGYLVKHPEMSPKREIDEVTSYSHLGRTSLPRQFLERPNIGDIDEGIIALRDKIPGSRFVKTKTKDGYVFRGYCDIPITMDFPVEVAEWYGGKFHIIYPYGLWSFTYRDRFRFEEHPWYSVRDYKPRYFAEGMMILTSSGEYRTKYSHTWEMDGSQFGLPGIWEVTFGRLLHGKGGAIVPLRPRPGKVPQRMSMVSVRSNVNTGEFLSILQGLRSRYVVATVKGGPYYGSMVRQIESNGQFTISIDSGWRLGDDGFFHRTKLEPWKPGQQPQSVEVESPTVLYQTPINSPIGWKVRLGVKVVPYDARTRLMKVIDDSGKPTDHLGGGLHIGEVPLQGLLREACEEIGKPITDMNNFVYLGYREYVDSEAMELGRTHMYLCPSYVIPESPFIKYVNPWNASGDDCAKWFLSNQSFFHEKVGDHDGVVALLNSVFRRDSVIRDVVSFASPFVTSFLMSRNLGRTNLELDMLAIILEGAITIEDLSRKMIMRGYLWDVSVFNKTFIKVIPSDDNNQSHSLCYATPRGADFGRKNGLLPKVVWAGGKEQYYPLESVDLEQDLLHPTFATFADMPGVDH